MRIGIDLRALEGGAQHRGIGRYATDLIEELAKIDGRNTYVFLASSKQVQLPAFNLPKSFKYFYEFGNGPGFRRKAKFVRTLHVTKQPLKIDPFQLDVLFQLDIQQPIITKTTPVVPVVYDLIPFLYKDIYQYLKLEKKGIAPTIFYLRHKAYWRVSEKLLRGYVTAASVISISEYSKQDLIRFLPEVRPEKVHAIPLAAGKTPKTDEAAKKKLSKLKLGDFLFYVGGADPRKGLVKLVQDMEEVWKKHPEVRLVLAGKEVIDADVPEARRLAEHVKKCSRPSQVILLGFITDGELAWFYENAKAFVFPSIHEGFGLPILEAMQAGCPAIAYNNTSIPEVAGNAAILIENGQPLAPAINKLLSDSKAHKKYADLGLKQAAKFTWNKTAKATLEVLEMSRRK